MASNEDIPDKEPIVPQSMQVRKLLFFQQDSEILLQDRYLLKKKIGSGGMGEIFKGIDIKNNNFEIAVKRLFSSEPIADNDLNVNINCLQIFNIQILYKHTTILNIMAIVTWF